jgi:hypothetical protein
MATQNGSLEKATENRGRPFWASSEERVKLRGSPTRQLTLGSPTLRVGGGRSGVGVGG